jgi:hypothetical protein
LAAGVLAIREPGGPDDVSTGIGPGEGLPRVITAGRLLAPPGRFFPGLAREVEAADLPAAAAAEARRSGGWAKVIGDWVAPDGHIRRNYPAATLAEAARRVHARGGRLAIHATVPETISDAIAAGFDSIEHGIGLTDEHIAAMAARATALVPTMTILPNLPAVVTGLGLTPAAAATTLAAADRHPTMVGRAAASGVLVLAGTDAGMVPHGLIREEIARLVGAEITPTAALAAGSWTARRYLGLPGLGEGAPADLVAYADDPRRDPAVLERPALCLLEGQVVRLPVAAAVTARR